MALLGSGLLNSAGLVWLSSAWFGSAQFGSLGLAQLAWLSRLGLVQLAWLDVAELGLAARMRRGHPIDDTLGAINDSSTLVMHCLSGSLRIACLVVKT